MKEKIILSIIDAVSQFFLMKFHEDFNKVDDLDGPSGYKYQYETKHWEIEVRWYVVDRWRIYAEFRKKEHKL